MSRRKRGAARPSATQTAAHENAANPPSAKALDAAATNDVEPRDPATVWIRLFAGLWLSIFVAIAWLITLLILAAFTANPITLNRDQILRSQLVVTGSFDAAQPNTLMIDKEWVKGANLQNVTVENLADSGARAGEKYVVPLSKDAKGRFFVTQTKDDRLLIYPAEEEALRQLETILREHR